MLKAFECNIELCGMAVDFAPYHELYLSVSEIGRDPAHWRQSREGLCESLDPLIGFLSILSSHQLGCT